MARTARNSLATRPDLASLPPLSRVLVDLGLAVARWDMHRRSRLALARLDPRMLRDIGLNCGEAQTECAKPFWRD